MIDEPAPFLSVAEMAARREERQATPVVNVATVGRWEMPRAPMTPRAAAAAFLHGALLARLGG